MRILGIIPARGGSKGVPGKNIKELGGQPLLAYTILQSLQSRLLTRVIVSSDDSDIINCALAYGAEVPFVRPDFLADDKAASIAVVQHAVAFLESENEYFDAVCLLQATSPFREKGSIDKAIARFIESEADALVSVLPVPHEFNPHWVFEPDRNGFLSIATGEAKIIGRRQELPPAFFRDGSIYLTKTECIKEGTFYGEKLAFTQSNPELYVNIDSPDDWKAAEMKLPTIMSLI
ncbi:acylneuraminate cytidylyltransferase [Flavobacterium magnum]|uniref:Acylneuraminate cytidylyltransferase n=1 Tax=Flavobacterium magnum TaxID=2162713 RepID=A0A2S0RFB4_9FLAO|nr:acylneuraminate cytidylyltransferase family protein [Flavobacterium magnum]AWA29781.1 acylneuraminate cytidylyltransferase [Flavobacterium magnum]